jgi:hypothetical protein
MGLAAALADFRLQISVGNKLVAALGNRPLRLDPKLQNLLEVVFVHWCTGHPS